MTLINYFKIIDNIDFNEINKCINTISFVINHMCEELKNVENFNTSKYTKLINYQT